MSEQETRAVVAGIIRGLAGGASAIVGVIPGAPNIGSLIGIGGELVAGLVETLGTNKAEETLRRLVANPVQMIRRSDLDAQTDEVRRAFVPGYHRDGD
jgi:hypothetical protein